MTWKKHGRVWRATFFGQRIAAASIERHGTTPRGKPDWRARVTFADYHGAPQSWWVLANNVAGAMRSVERYLSTRHDHQECCNYDHLAENMPAGYDVEHWNGDWRYKFDQRGYVFMEFSAPYPTQWQAAQAAHHHHQTRRAKPGSP